MIPRISSRTFTVALAVAATVTVVVWRIAPPLYLTNDDVMMRLSVEGRLVPGKAASGFVLMMHAALAWGIAWLQQMWPEVVVWDLVLSAALVLALAVLLALTWTAAPSPLPLRVAAVLAVLTTAVPLLSGMQFTISATLAGGAAAALLYAELSSNARPRNGALMCASLLLVFGILIRPMAGAAGALLTSALLAPASLMASRHGGWTAVRRLGAQVAGIVALAVALLYADRALYRVAPEWQRYEQYNWMAARLFEWGGEVPPEDAAIIRQAVAWSQNDWRMLQSWWGVDPDAHGFATVERAYGVRARQVTWQSWVRWLTGRVASDPAAVLQDLLEQSYLSLIVAGVVLVLFGSASTLAASGIALALFVAACVGITAAFKDLPFRLLAPLQVCLVAAILLTAVTATRRRPVVFGIVASVVLAGVAAVELRAIARQASAEQQHSEQVRDEVRRLLAMKPSLLVLHADAFPAEHWWHPFEPSRSLPSVPLGMNNQNPLLQSLLDQTHRQPLILAICRDRSILVVAEEGRLDFATQYMHEHYDVNVGWEQVLAASFDAFRCTAVDHNP